MCECVETFGRAEVTNVKKLVLRFSCAIADPARHSQVPELICMSFQVLGHACEESDEVLGPWRNDAEWMVDSHADEQNDNVTTGWLAVRLALLVHELRRELFENYVVHVRVVQPTGGHGKGDESIVGEPCNGGQQSETAESKDKQGLDHAANTEPGGQRELVTNNSFESCFGEEGGARAVLARWHQRNEWGCLLRHDGYN